MVNEALLLLMVSVMVGLPILTILSVGVGVGLALWIKKPVSISISATPELLATQEPPPGDLCCTYCGSPFPRDEQHQRSWLYLSTNAGAYHACCVEHMQQVVGSLA
jgi:hypothetical protein